MSSRTALIGFLLLAFLAARSFGVHWHDSHAHSAVLDSHVHVVGHGEPVETAAEPITLFDAHHFVAHALQGDIDLDSSAAGASPSNLKLALVLLALLILPLVLCRRRPTRSFLPPPRPPPGRSRIYLLLPPSQAPPRFA